MSVIAFISYSHADEKALDRLHKHLAMLQRDGTLSTWTDHEILPGQKIGDTINANLSNSQLFLALVSPDYLASNYCYEKEFKQAQEFASAGTLRIVPIVLEPCDWLSSPLSEYMALPKDGRPISEWTNQNNAYLDVVTGLRRLTNEPPPLSDNEGGRPSRPNIRRPKIKQDFDAIQRSEFADQAFNTIRQYFRNSCTELNEAGDGRLKAKFENMDDTAFSCTVVNRGRQSGAEAHITLRNTRGRNHFGDLTYIFERCADSNSSNGSIGVEADDYNLFLTLNTFGSRHENKLSAEQAAEALWIEFVGRVGIEYE